MLRIFPAANNAERGSDGARCKSPAIDLPLTQAATAYAFQTRGLPVLRVSLHYGDGSELNIPVPEAEASAESPPRRESAHQWPPTEGWDFRPGQAAFNGRVFKCKGKAHTILMLLVAYKGAPMSDKYLIQMAWDEDPKLVGKAALQTHVSLLRKTLRSVFNLGNFNPIECVDGAYALNFPNVAIEGSEAAAI